MNAEIDMLIHINDLSLKTLFEDKLAHCPGFTRSPRLSHKSHLLFLQFDRERFDLGSVQEVAGSLGAQVRIVGL